MKPKSKKNNISMPKYPKGEAGMIEFIVENLIYPKEALEKVKEGAVYMKYDINHQGKVVEVKVIKGIGYGCDEEAVRLVKLLKFEVEQNFRNLKVVFHNDIWIKFNLKREQTPIVEIPIKEDTSNNSIIDHNSSSTNFTYNYIIKTKDE
jgi:TonB family protein